MGNIKVGDVVTCVRPPYTEPECRLIRASRVFFKRDFYLVLGFWYNDQSICAIMSSCGSTSWIASSYLVVISEVVDG